MQPRLDEVSALRAEADRFAEAAAVHLQIARELVIGSLLAIAESRRVLDGGKSQIVEITAESNSLSITSVEG